MQGFYNGKTDTWVKDQYDGKTRTGGIMSDHRQQLPNPFVKYKHHPDASKHQLISFIKSGVRIVGYIWLPINIMVAAIILVVSEIIGIYEELV